MGHYQLHATEPSVIQLCLNVGWTKQLDRVVAETCGNYNLGSSGKVHHFTMRQRLSRFWSWSLKWRGAG